MAGVSATSVQGNATYEENMATLAWNNIPYLSVCITLGVVIAFGNGMTVIVICKREMLRTIPNKFILNLAVIDLLICMEIVFDMFTVIGVKKIIPCLMLSLWDVSSLLSLIGMVLIAADRLVYISRPLHYHLLITPTRANAAIAASWFIGLVLFASELSWSYGNNLIKSCDFVSPLWLQTTMVFVFCTLNGTMILLYGMLIRLAMKHRKRIVDAANGFKQRVMLSSDFKFLKLILSVVMFYEACWIPYLILFLVEKTSEPKYANHAWQYIAILFYLNSAVNFFIYAARDKDFYNAYKLLLSCRR